MLKDEEWYDVFHTKMNKAYDDLEDLYGNPEDYSTGAAISTMHKTVDALNETIRALKGE